MIFICNSLRNINSTKPFYCSMQWKIHSNNYHHPSMTYSSFSELGVHVNLVTTSFLRALVISGPQPSFTHHFLYTQFFILIGVVLTQLYLPKSVCISCTNLFVHKSSLLLPISIFLSRSITTLFQLFPTSWK